MIVDETDEKDGELAHVNTVRIGAHPAPGFDRFVIEFFDAGIRKPRFAVFRQDSAVFGDADGESVTLKGEAGLRIVVRSGNMDAHDLFPPPEHVTGSGTTVLHEAQFISTQNGDVEYGLALAKASCFRAFRLLDPPRLVVDVKR